MYDRPFINGTSRHSETAHAEVGEKAAEEEIHPEGHSGRAAEEWAAEDIGEGPAGAAEELQPEDSSADP